MGAHDLAQLLRAVRNMNIRQFAKTTGNVYFVIKSTETYYSYFVEQFQATWEDGSNSIHNTIESAKAVMINGRNDIMVLDGNSSHTLTAMLAFTASHNRMHIMGLDYFMGVKRATIQSSKIVLPVTTEASDIGILSNLGTRNSFRGIKFISNNTQANSLYGVVEGGEGTVYDGIEVYKSTDLDETGAAEFVWNGDNTTLINSTIGSQADEIQGSSIIRPAILLTKGIADTGKVSRDGVIENTVLWRKTKDTTNAFIRSANADDVERTLVLKHVGFINNPLGTNNPAVAISAASALTVGSIVLDPTCYSANCTKIATQTGVFVTGPVGSASAGIQVQAA